MKSALTTNQSITAVGTKFSSQNWLSFRLTSAQALLETTNQTEPPFHYELVAVRGDDRILLLGPAKAVTTFAIRSLNRELFPNIRTVTIRIDLLVKAAGDRSIEYAMTHLQGDFSGPRTNIKNVTINGRDITGSSLYEQQASLFTFTYAGIAKRYPDEGQEEAIGGEILALGNDGFVYIHSLTRTRAPQVLDTLRMINNHGWIIDR